MRFLDEFRDANLAKKYLSKIHALTSKSWSVMEICGGQTHAIMKYGIDQIIPEHINLIHGPGCPVCVTSLTMVDKAIAIAKQEKVIFCTFGDMMRVPGSHEDLFSVKARGSDVRMVYSPLDALLIAEKNRDKKVVFFAIGFETTIPGNALAVLQAEKKKLDNFSILVSQVRVPPAINAILSSENNQVQGFLLAGHVNAVMGTEEYDDLIARHQVPMVVTGFEPVDILYALSLLVESLEQGRADLKNAYGRLVRREGNRGARDAIDIVFKTGDQIWRGIGLIPDSGYILNDKYDQFNAEKIFSIEEFESQESEDCISGEILQGIKKPDECPLFATECTPEKAKGATMVSSEGACAAYYNYRRNEAR